jgi:hypothetical protein
MSPLSPGRAPVRRVAVQTRALVLSVALLTASPALSQSTLSLDEALRQALAADPAAAGAAARLDASKAQARQADTRPNPGLGVEVENFTGSGRFSALGRTETTVSYQQTYERGGKRQARIALAQSEISLVQARAEVRRLDLAKAVQLAFVEVLAAQAQVAVAEEQLSIAQRAERGSAAGWPAPVTRCSPEPALTPNSPRPGSAWIGQRPIPVTPAQCWQPTGTAPPRSSRRQTSLKTHAGPKVWRAPPRSPT